MDAQARNKLMLELTAERDESNWKAAQHEELALLVQGGEHGDQELADAGKLRERARELQRRLSELEDEAEHDDDRGGIER
jgi:hypothetical protein